MRLIIPLLMLVLTACGDPEPEPRPVSIATPDVDEIVALDGREMRRLRDAKSGVSFPFPKSWRVVAGNPLQHAWPLWHAWAREGGPRTDRTVANVAVTVDRLPRSGARGYVERVRSDALRRAIDRKIHQGTRQIDSFTANTYRFTWAGSHGPVTEEIFVFVKGKHVTRLVATSHDDVRAPFSESLATILEGFQWAAGE